MANQTGLNDPQKRHLLSSCQYADKLLSEIEAIVRSSESKSVFPKYYGEIPPAQIRVIEDYIARIRAQMLTALRSQAISVPERRLDTVHSIKVTLLFANIAFEECTADKMRGYGEVPAQIVPELNGLVTEIKSILDRLSGFLGQRLDQDPAERLRRLEKTGDEIEVLKKLERVIARQRLVDYRARVSAILDGVESNNFEISFFGRVSSGKSSLLNHIVGADILPVGVNPITAIPTRIVYGGAPRICVAAVGEHPQLLGVERIADFVTEQSNPGNKKRIERLVVEYPSKRLKDGVTLVDTPGLGSLATAGAAETLAYLPRCDLGVVLIDAGSTLTAEDVATMRALNEAAIETVVLLSKADLLGADDLAKAEEYTAQQIRVNLGAAVPVSAVSVQPGFVHLLEDWFARELAPRFDAHRQLAQESMRRKVGALREAVTGMLQARLDRARQNKAGPKGFGEERRDGEALLRRVSGRFEQVREEWFRKTLELREYGAVFLRDVARQVVEMWRGADPRFVLTWEALSDLALKAAATRAGAIRLLMDGLAADLSAAIRETSSALAENNASASEELKGAIKEMPRIDLGAGEFRAGRPWTTAFVPRLAVRALERSLRASVGEHIQGAFAVYATMLDAWCRGVAGELQLVFSRYADAQRTRIAGVEADDPVAIRAALQDLASDMEPSPAIAKGRVDE